jgi:ABC-type uncharacterized transport system permease subunit
MNFHLVDALFVLTATTYLLACVLFVVHLVARRDDGTAVDGRLAVVGRIAPRLVAVGAALHAVHIVSSSFASHVCPVEGIHFAMSVVSMLACVLYVAMRTRYRIDVVGVFVAPLALTFLLASRFVGTGALGGEPSSRMQGVILPFHVAANMLGVALFTLAFASAALYLVVERRLKQKKIVGVFQRLPALDALDRAEHRFLLAGFPLLTIGILTGTLWARHVEAGSPADIARAAFGYASWLLFAAVLLLRAAAGWRGRRAAYGTIAGFGATLIVLIIYLIRSVASAGGVAALAWGGP